MDEKKYQRLVLFTISLALAMTFSLVAMLGWQLFTFHKEDELIQKNNLKLAANVENIFYYEEKMNMSAKMAAATEDLSYEKRYNEAEEKLDELIKKTILFFSESNGSENHINKIKSAKTKLSEMDKKAFALVHQGRLSEATEILNRAEYDKQLMLYFHGIDEAFNQLKNKLRDTLDEEKRERLLFFILGVFGGIIVFISWILSIKTIRKWNKERIEYEERLSEREKDLSDAQRVAHIGNWTWNPETGKLKWADENYKIFGISPQVKPSYKEFLKYVHPDDSGFVETSVEEALQGKKGYNIDFRIIKPDGSEGVVNTQAEVIFDNAGKPLKMIGTIQDITERKKSGEAIRQSSEFAKTILDSITDSVSIINTDDFRIIGANRKFLEDFGKDESDIIGRTCFEVTHNRDCPCLPPDDPCPITETLKTGKYSIAEHIHYDKDGGKIFAEVSASPIRDNYGNVKQIVHVSRNVTERRAMEEEIRKSEEFLKTIFTSMSDGMVITDLNGKILKVNDYFCKLLGYKSEELIGQFGIKYYPEKNGNKIKESFNKFKKEQIADTIWELDLFAKSGELIPVSSRRTLLKDKNGNPFAVMAVFRDMREMRKLQEQLFQAEKLSATGGLIAGVAHELNNPLTGVIGYSELLMKDINLTEKAAQRIKIIYEQSNRCKNIISNLLKFARKYNASKSEVSINEIIDSTLALNLYEMESGGIKVIKDLKRDIPKVFGDMNHLQSVILNLTQNAHHSLLEKKEGERILKIKSDYIDDKIIIKVSDTGTGITEENIKKIFDPFFTTKEVGKGTGLGLSISHGIIKDHGGNIAVKSNNGEGTTFIVELPALSGKNIV